MSVDESWLEDKGKKKRFANEIEVGNGPDEYEYVQYSTSNEAIEAESKADHRRCRTRIDESRTTT